MYIYFLSFADTKCVPMLKRIRQEANDSNFFDIIKTYNEKSFDKKYRKKYRNRFKLIRGYGYWMWKSYLVKRELENMSNDDILVYMDAGCTINKNGAKRFYEYISYVKETKCGVLAFLQESFIENVYTKSDIFNYIGCLNNKNITDTPQFWAGAFIIRKCDHSVSFINKWYDLCHNHFDLITDSPSLINNSSNFIENRHDQSAFSVLLKLFYKPYIISYRENFTYGDFHKDLNIYPIWATRRKSFTWWGFRKMILLKHIDDLLDKLFR